MADYTKRDGQIPSRFVYIYTLLSSSYCTSRKIYYFCTKVLAVIVITSLLTRFDKNARSESYYPCYSESGKFSYISKFHIIISCKSIVYIVMCFYQETN